MGTIGMASGRMPSMERITTRRARASGVGVAEGVGVSVGGSVAVMVAVAVGGSVSVAVALGGATAIPGLGIWQASSSRMEKIEISSLRVLSDGIVIVSL